MCYVTGWYRGEKRAVKFAIPRIWPQPTDHSSNCYFCMVDPTKRRTGKNAPQIFIQIVLLPLPSITLPRAACSQSPEEASAIFRRQQQVRYWRSSYVFTDTLRREGHTFLTRKTPTI